MEFRRYLASFQRWWWLLALGTGLATAVSFVVTRQLPPVYEATSTLLVNVSTTPGALSYNDALLSQQLVKTYTQMAAQPVVLAAVSQRLKLDITPDELGRRVTVQPVRDTQLFTIKAVSSTAAQARDMADAVAAVFIDHQNQRLAQSQAANAISVVQPALLPLRPVGPSVPLNTALAGVIGLSLMAGIVFLLEYLDDTVKTQEELEQSGLPVLGSVPRLMPRDGVRDTSLVIDVIHPRSAAAESYRLLRTNLDFLTLDQPMQTLVVTSAGASEGKSTTVANLALVLAQAGKRVIAIDADLRKPTLHRLFELDNRQGLTNILLEQGAHGTSIPSKSYLQPGPVPLLKVLTSGPLPPNPSELLQSAQFVALLEQLREDADAIILDSPPALMVADALVLAQRVDSALLVVHPKHSRRDAVIRAVAALRQSGTRVAGAVFNNVSHSARDRYYYHYYGHEDSRDGYEAASSSIAKAATAEEQTRTR